MNLKTITSAAELPFAGVELIRVNKAIAEVVIGGKLRIKPGPSYANALELLVEAPYETATRYRVTATIDGFDPKITHHESEYDAKRAVEDFEAKGAVAAFEKVEVQIDDAGNVVGDNDAAPPAKPSDNEDIIPF